MAQLEDFPLVSVLCICGAHGRFVGECLRSVEAQTWPNLEILVLDNASSDDSLAVIEDWAASTLANSYLSYGPLGQSF
jgi:glycosyltransferase involved in cell wall biosynthesis